MNRKRGDVIVSVLVGIVLLGGGVLSWQAYQQRQALDQSMGSMMDSSMGAMYGPNPLWYVFGTLLAAAVIGGGYLLVREDLSTPSVEGKPGRSDAGPGPDFEMETNGNGSESAGEHPESAGDHPESAGDDTKAAGDDTKAASDDTKAAGDGPESTASINPEAQPEARVLDLLPDDERRVLEPVLSSPGITQIALRDRSDFSKSKVSQTVSALEERGLLYRERQGRTYRVYPSEDLKQQQSNQ